MRDMHHVKQRDDIECHYEDEFEPLILEISYNNASTIVGEIYIRVPNTSLQVSLPRYETILRILKILSNLLLSGHIKI